MSGGSPVEVGFMRLDPRSVPPARATEGASGFDLRACLESPLRLAPGQVRLVPTGLALVVPRGYEGQVRARSGLALRHGIAVLNGPGTVDSDYRGPLGIILANFGAEPFEIGHGGRIAQLVIASVPPVDLVEVGDLPPTDRGEGGFGHTGIL